VLKKINKLWTVEFLS